MSYLYKVELRDGIIGNFHPLPVSDTALSVDLAPRISLGKLCNILKTISSREMRKEFATELKPSPLTPLIKGGKEGGIWKQGYGYTSAGGAAIDVLIKYIENQ